MTQSPETPPKPHSIWLGIAILAVLLLLAALSGSLTPLGILVGLSLFLPPALGAFLAAFLAAYRPTEEQVITTARALSILFTCLLGTTGAALLQHGRGEAVTGEMITCVFVIFCMVGMAVSVFASPYAVYLFARRSGKSHDEAQQASRWDPKRYWRPKR